MMCDAWRHAQTIEELLQAICDMGMESWYDQNGDDYSDVPTCSLCCPTSRRGL